MYEKEILSLVLFCMNINPTVQYKILTQFLYMFHKFVNFPLKFHVFCKFICHTYSTLFCFEIPDLLSQIFFFISYLYEVTSNLDKIDKRTMMFLNRSPDSTEKQFAMFLRYAYKENRHHSRVIILINGS